MKKIFLILCLISNLVVINLENVGATSVSPQECFIHDADRIQLGNFRTIEGVYPVLGEILSFVQGVPSDAYIPTYVIYERGTVWFNDISGKSTVHTSAKIMQIIFTKKDVYTTKGVNIGDNIQKVYDTYGYPTSSWINDFTPYNGIVDHWDYYSPLPGKFEHLEFGSRKGKVTAICVSAMP